VAEGKINGGSVAAGTHVGAGAGVIAGVAELTGVFEGRGVGEAGAMLGAVPQVTIGGPKPPV
jgi:hypothetical protein